MNTLFAGMIGGWEMVLILAVVLILFGAKKLPELAKGLGQGIREFKKASNDLTSEVERAMDDHSHPLPPARRIETASVPPAESSTAPKAENTVAPKA